MAANDGEAVTVNVPVSLCARKRRTEAWMPAKASDSPGNSTRADAVSSLAAFVGISIAILGGPGWEAADDWAALVAAVLVAVNGVRTLRPAISGLMDAAPDHTVKARVLTAAMGVKGVRNVENLNVRGSGLGFHVDLHVQADPSMSLEDAHEIAATVKYAIVEAMPNVVKVLVHMEPYREASTLAEDPVFSLPPV